jgi:excisionase family DNA binding protein
MERDEVMKVEGVYMYLCKSCMTSFGVVSRFSIVGDKIMMLTCPKCSKKAYIHGEGHMKYEKYKANNEAEVVEENMGSITKEPMEIAQLPEILTVKHISVILNASKRTVYEMMERTDFPLIRVGRLKRVRRDKFFEWLDKSK